MPETDLHARFGGVTDDAWLDLLRRSLTERVIDDTEFPGFPDAATQQLFVGRPPEDALAEAFAFYRIVKDACAAHGCPLGPRTRLLDVGVGWARVLRCFMKDVAPGHLFGVDVNADILAFCREQVPTGRYALCTPGAPLPFPAAAFDVVESFSVFSHLSARAQEPLVDELYRVLRPGGLFVLTTLSRRFLAFCQEAAADPSALDGLGRELAELVRQTWPNWRRALRWHARRGMFASRELFYLASGGGIANTAPADYGWAMVTPAWVRKHWGTRFELLEHVDDPDRLEQAWFVLRRR